MPAILRCFRIAGFLFSKEGCYITQNEVNAVFDEQVRLCADTLKRKTKEYTGDDPDRLGAFKAAAALQHTTPQRALAGMLAKHIVSLYDMCFAEEVVYPMDTWDEKITDSLNYLFLLKAIVKEGHTIKQIEVKILNCQAVAEAEKNMVFAARLTQQGHKIASMDDLMELYEKSFSVQTVAAMGALPHPTIQKFAVITVAIVGASRRFLAQITRHQNEVKFMSASLQYSNYTGQADFAVPYSIMTAPAVVRELYLKSCNESMKCYEALCTAGSGHDAAGYATPQGLRNVLLISATPYQWKHIISQRVCRRNTDETRIVLLKVWKELYELSPALFAPSLTGPFCQMDRCLEGKMTCGRKLQANMTPEDILEKDYPALWEGDCR